jgi:hypothetical protein
MSEALDKLEKLKSDFPGLRKEKRPRQYAQEIIVMTTKEQRRAALEQVPEQFRDWVKFYVIDHFNKRRKP